MDEITGNKKLTGWQRLKYLLSKLVATVDLFKWKPHRCLTSVFSRIIVTFQPSNQ